MQHRQGALLWIDYVLRRGHLCVESKSAGFCEIMFKRSVEFLYFGYKRVQATNLDDNLLSWLAHVGEVVEGQTVFVFTSI